MGRLIGLDLGEKISYWEVKDGQVVHKGELLFVIDPANRRSIPLSQVMDAYGLTQAEAHQALRGFLRHSQARGARLVIVVAGLRLSLPNFSVALKAGSLKLNELPAKWIA